MLASIALLYDNPDSQHPIVVVDEGQDFDELMDEWLNQEEEIANAGDEETEAQSMSLGEFLITRGVKVFDEPSVYIAQ